MTADQAGVLQGGKWAVDNHGYCSVVVSEGVRHPDGRFLADAGTTDAFGHAQLGGVASVIAAMVKEELGFKYHYAISDYLQRSARHLASKTDLEQAYAVGEKAIELAVAGRNSVMPVIKRLQDDPYKWEIATAELKDLANVEKMVPREYITEDGFGITAACRKYLQPLIVGEAYPPYNDNGLPNYVRLSQQLAPQKLAKFDI